MNRKTAVTGPNQPHEQVLAGLAVAWGLVYALAPGSRTLVEPGWLAVAWAVSLSLSGAMVLAGVWWRGAVATGLQLERAGLLLSTGSLWVIAGAIAVAGDARASVALGLIIGWGVANVVRARQIQGQVKAIVSLMRESE